MKFQGIIRKLFLFFFLVWIAYQAGISIYELHKLKQKETRMQIEIARLKAKQVVLEQRRLFLKTKKGIETIATKRLGMVPPSVK